MGAWRVFVSVLGPEFAVARVAQPHVALTAAHKRWCRHVIAHDTLQGGRHVKQVTGHFSLGLP